MEYKIQYKFSVLHWTLRSAEVIEHPYTPSPEILPCIEPIAGLVATVQYST